MLDAQTKAWVEAQLGRPLTKIEALDGGKNNRALLMHTDAGLYFLKLYFSEPHEPASRYQREIRFYQMLGRHAVQAVPNLLEADGDLQVALFNYIDATRLAYPEHQDLQQAAEFIRDINREEVWRDAGDIPAAKGSLISGQAFVDDLLQRFAQLSALPVCDDIDAQMHAYLADSVSPALDGVVSRILTAAESHRPFRRILSPSDFGFHNALKAKRLVFFDFEYAGWDSAEKLVTDFFAQPRYALLSADMPWFIAHCFPGQDNAQLLAHCQTLMPAAIVKWSLIFLNEFKQSDRMRRQFSAWQQDHAETRLRQLDKSRRKLAEIDQQVKE